VAAFYGVAPDRWIGVAQTAVIAPPRLPVGILRASGATSARVHHIECATCLFDVFVIARPMTCVPTAISRSTRTLAVVLALACVPALAPSGAAARAPREPAPQYPVAATRPMIVVSPRALAHASSGGTVPGAAKRSKGKSRAKRRPVLSSYAVRALLAYDAMQQNFYIPGAGLYRGEPQFSFLWPFSQALAATVSLSYIPGTNSQLADVRRALMVGLRQYLSPPAAPAAPESGEPPPGGETSAAEQATGVGQPPSASTTSQAPSTPAPAAASAASTMRSYDGNVAPPVGPGGDSFYDDNEWVGIELARLYELNHSPEALQQAQQIMAFVMAGWQTTGPAGRPLPCPGGVPFSNGKGNVSRNTVTNGPGVELAVQLYRITHEIHYLEFAEMAYGWVRICLLEPSGLYADHINLNGSVQRTLWSYNQGSMMGAGMLLYLATRNPEYLTQARQTAKAALAYFTYSRLSGENPFFAAVYFRNLLYLDYFTHETPGLQPVREYAYYAWLRHRLSDNLFAYGSPPTAELLRQAAIVQVYALLSTPPSTYF
jgi:hypothetical protein